MSGKTQIEELDLLVVGAGVAGLYLIYRLRKAGFRVKAVEEAGGVGGTWYWNRYPGARCDVDSVFYSYEFDDALQQEWNWTERYAGQPEILKYLNHVADRHELRPDIIFETRVVSAHYDEAKSIWDVRTDNKNQFRTKYCVMATGCLSAANVPDIAGLNEFEGPVYHTARWPHKGVDFSGVRVGVIGTGSTAIQAIPEIAKSAAHLTVFQRTPNYAIPAQNRPLKTEEILEVKAKYPELRAQAKTTPGGFNFVPNDISALEVSAEERNQEFEQRWQAGGIPFMGAYNDLTLNEESNRTAQEFVRGKIREIVRDPTVASLLSPDNVIGCKRLCLDTDYYQTFNRDNVHLVDVRTSPIETISPDGVKVAGELHKLGALVLATGFDAMTGALTRIDIRGRSGKLLADKWRGGPRTYLGLATAGFPNLFIVTGPGSPSVLSNMLPTIEQHVEWISDCIEDLRQQGANEIEAENGAEDDWIDHVNDVAAKTLRVKCDSWYLGANIPGKPRVFMPYIGGMPAYRQKCDEVASSGYTGFRIS